jgi:nicotinamide mononucleotide transporter
MGINIFYFVMSVYGWINWVRKKNNVKIIRISKCNWKYHAINAISLIVLFIAIRYVLINFTDSTVPNIDSLTTAIFIIAMWLMANKKIENWIAWIIGDIISIPLYAYKGLIFTSFQFLVFLILAIAGYIEWRKKLHERQTS